MIIALKKEVILDLIFIQKKSESYHLIKGKMTVFVFDKGNLIKKSKWGSWFKS